MIDLRRFQAGEWLLVALAMVGLGLAFMPRPNPCDAKVVKVEIAGDVWSIPADLQPRLETGPGGRVYPTRFDGGRYGYCRAAKSPPMRQRAFYLKKAAFGTVAFRDPERFGSLARLEQLHVSADSSGPRAPGAYETYGPVLFGRPMIKRCTDVTGLSQGRVRFDCRLAGWTPSGAYVWMQFYEQPDDGMGPALEALLRDFLNAA